ncbi:MAG: winged helix-turn-helix transcriptional regulator [Chloroflexi bacterium]|nr:winged helix-turn-helix transcriptional regulator [Chloroflexota bacterium]
MTTDLKSPEEELNLVFSALSDPTRRSILERLSAGEASVGELAEPFDMSLPAISKHLGVLEQAGLLSRERDGRFFRCLLQAEAMRDAALWMERYRRFWAQQFDALDAYLSHEEEPEDDTQ